MLAIGVQAGFLNSEQDYDTEVWYGMVWYGIVWYGMVWYDMVWYGTVSYTHLTLPTIYSV